MSLPLQNLVQTLGPNEEVSIIITLSDKGHIKHIKDETKDLLRSKIIKALKVHADLGQDPIRAFLEKRGANKTKSLWMINAIATTIPVRLMDDLLN
jgi:DNA-binding ferritin-like protein